jgi:hypothetical protein
LDTGSYSLFLISHFLFFRGVVHAQLGQNAEGGLGVKESDELVVGSGARGFVDEADTLSFKFGQLGLDIVHGEGDVVDATGRILFEVLGDRAVGGGGLEKLEVYFTHFIKSGANFLVGDFLYSVALEAEDLFVEAAGFLKVWNGDAEVVDFLEHKKELNVVCFAGTVEKMCEKNATGK